METKIAILITDEIVRRRLDDSIVCVKEALDENLMREVPFCIDASVIRLPSVDEMIDSSKFGKVVAGAGDSERDAYDHRPTLEEIISFGARCTKKSEFIAVCVFCAPIYYISKNPEELAAAINNQESLENNPEHKDGVLFLAITPDTRAYPVVVESYLDDKGFIHIQDKPDFGQVGNAKNFIYSYKEMWAVFAAQKLMRPEIEIVSSEQQINNIAQMAKGIGDPEDSSDIGDDLKNLYTKFGI